MAKVGRYNILETLRQNHKTITYKAIDENDSIVTIKTVLEPNDQETINKLYREFNIGKMVDNRYSPIYIELLELDRVYIVKSYINGEILADQIPTNGMDLEQFISQAIYITTAVKILHNQHILHLDLNPRNILCNKSKKEIRLLDFGESIVYDPSQKIYSKELNTKKNAIYDSPELTGLVQKSIDFRSDLYSIGVIFYEMLSAKPIFDFDDEIELAHAHLAIIPEPLHTIRKDIPIILSNIVSKLLSKDKNDRYQSAEGLLYDLYLAQNDNFKEFELGLADLKTVIKIPKKLYGRSSEIDTIREFISNSHTKNAPALITVSGYSGVGKTAFIEQLKNELFLDNSCFIRGKFDQYNRTTSYIAFAQAFRMLFNFLDINLSIVKNDLIELLGESRHIIAKIIPDIADFLDADLSHHMDSLQLKNQLFIAIERTLLFTLKYKKEIVLFIDDLQWIDSASIEIFDLLFSSKKLSKVIIIGVYRSNEVNDLHPIKLSIDRLSKNIDTFFHLTLEPLKIAPIKELLREMLQNDKIDDLASLLLQKTGGNPFFLRQFLDTLYDRKLLIFDNDKKLWSWNIEEIKKQNLTDNVVEHLIDKIDTLSKHTQVFLKTASVIGDTFNIRVINSINNFSNMQIFIILQEVLSEGLVEGIEYIDTEKLLEDHYFNFSHDKIRQAAYSLIDENDKKIKHSLIAKELIAHPPYSNTIIVQIANHILESAQELYDIDTNKLIDILARAAIITKDSLAFDESIKFSKFAISLLSDDSWSSDYQKTFDIYYVYLDSISRFYSLDEATIYFDDILKIKELIEVDTAKILHLESILYFSDGKLAESIRLGRAALKYLDIDIPDNPSELDALKKSDISFLDSKLEDISSFFVHQEVGDDKIALAMEILVTIGIPAFVSRQDMFGVFVFKLARLSIDYGVSPVSSYGFMLCAMIYGGGLNRFNDGQKFGNLAIKLQERFDNKSIECKLLRVYGAYVASWVNPHEAALDILYRGYVSGVENGDFTYAAYSANHIFTREILSDMTLEELEEKTRVYRDFIARANEPSILATQDLLIGVVKAFRGNTVVTDSFSSDEFDELEALEYFSKIGFKTLIAYYYIYKTQLCYTHEYFDEAIENAIKAREYLPNLKGNILESELYFYHSLSIHRKYMLNKSYIVDTALLQSHIEKFKLYSSLCTHNFESKYLTLKALYHHINNNFKECIFDLTKAVDLEDTKPISALKATLLELLGLIALSDNNWRIAKAYLQETYTIFYDLKYVIKAKLLYSSYSKLFLQDSTKLKIAKKQISKNTSDLNVFDEDTILKASELISGKSNKSELIEKFMQILASSFGIQLGALILKNGDEFYLEGLFNIDSKNKISLLHEDIHNTTQIPKTIISSVINSSKTLIIDDAVNDSKFSMDSSIIELGVVSAICAPIILKDELIGIVYMQNNLIKGFFDNTREKVLNILLTQTAVMLELEYLYSRDKLTGVLSRLKLDEAIERDEYSVLTLLNISNLDSINSTYGYLAGDSAIKLFVNYIAQYMTHNGTLYRLSGDEFVVLSYNVDVEYIESKVSIFLNDLNNHKFLLNDIYLQMGCTIGISQNSKNMSSSALVRAHAAMKEARKSGTNRLLVYNPDSKFIKVQQERLVWIHKVKDAISEDRIIPFFQPILDNITGNVYKFEVLARLIEDDKIISPFFFLEPARISGLLPEITKIMLEKSYKYFSNKPYDFSINITQEDLLESTLSSLLQELTDRYNIKPSRVTLEILENISVEENTKIITELESLQKYGFKIALDDFGSEKSNFMRLQSMNVDYIKIDGSYIKDIHTNPNSYKICQTIVHLARAIDCRIIAEFVHSKEVYEVVKSLGIEFSQGFYFAEPKSEV